MKRQKYDFKIIGISCAIVITVTLLLVVFPMKAPEVINNVLNFVTGRVLGDVILLITFILLIWSIYMAFGKYGKIKFGKEKPDYSMFQYTIMIMCAGLGASAVMWSFIEWAYYYQSPALGIEGRTTEAAEWATAYSFFHWGSLMWVTIVVAVLPLAYAYYNRKIESLTYGAAVKIMIGEDKPYAKISKVADYFTVFCTLGAMTTSLGLGVPILSVAIGEIFNFEPNTMTNIIIIAVIGVFYTVSSYVGIDKGMKRISEWNTYGAIASCIILVVTGPTTFIFAETINATGLMLGNIVEMSLWTDPINNGGFPEAWTIFFWCFGYACGPLMGIFITKISKGRTIREVVLAILGGVPLTVIAFFGINGSFAMDQQLSGVNDIATTLAEEGNAVATVSIVETGYGTIGIVAFGILFLLFLATSLDSSAFSLSAASTRALETGENTSPMLRLFWCAMLAAIPMAVLAIGGQLSSLQTFSIITSLPFIVVFCYMAVIMHKWLREDEKKNNI